MLIVESGLYDQNVGLEVFDKGDFTSTKEDKRIRLVRAMNGELARLIKRIDGIENASVFISIPEQSMFSSMQKPVTATVQLTVAVGQTLNMGTIKAVSNLLLGSVSGLTSENISITDVAMLSGIQSIRNFNRIYLEMTGRTPLQAAKKLSKNNRA
jgi:flagellar biosynthesis/type III secretory pathway M-ring protein FliF/YscJ